MPVRPPKFKIIRPLVQTRDTEASRIRSSPRMQALARAVLIRDPLCCDPLREHVGVLRCSVEAHHIVGLAVDPSLAFDMKNLKGLCEECHDSIEVLNLRGFDTRHLFAGKASGDEVTRSGCTIRRNSIYCARMKTFRVSKCAGCNTL